MVEVQVWVESKPTKKRETLYCWAGKHNFYRAIVVGVKPRNCPKHNG